MNILSFENLFNFLKIYHLIQPNLLRPLFRHLKLLFKPNGCRVSFISDSETLRLAGKEGGNSRAVGGEVQCYDSHQ